MEENKKLDVALSENTQVEEVDDLHGENLGDRVKVLSPGQMVAKRFFRSKLSMIGLVMLLLLFLISFIGPLFSPWTATMVDGTMTVSATPIPFTFETANGTVTGYKLSVENSTFNKFGNISAEHWLGTDQNGWDIFTRLMLGGRVSLTIGFVVVIIETILGVLLGGLAGYFGGWVDNLIMRIVDILSCIPSLPVMLIFANLLKSLGINDTVQLYYLMIILTFFGWTGTARLVRGQILTLREQEFMLAAKCSGLSTSRKLFKHLLPNVLPQLIVSMTLGLGGIILTEASLGFLGIGVPPDAATWGAMVNTIKIGGATWNFWLPAGICITLAILAFNFVGDGLRDAFDPKMKR